MKYKKLDYRVSKTALNVIMALCADYPRRKRLIECKFRTHTTDKDIENFKATNAVIDSALMVVDEGLREYMLMDIAVGHGYESSMASPYIAKNSYYLQKNKAIEEMAKGFHLII